ncbi:hypothetical protein [Bradyrhizobium arachidis]|uniref:Uncharacterized protein n=1 Tax=Bradyrhizobium arachidis TaxID=858423 RepID=A0AAE7NJ32_9BRAD|nr:hypothetical protein [Bradyrhizobium arachidis]QOZ66411.1 hypothetical protein WN72_08340 [Bradyrhizobium arachidis]SFV18295.1 hypothetical protein SAMN05192541_13412 [Bradyrhizobium arachidis]
MTKDQARRRLRAAQTTTQTIDEGELWPALERLQRAGAENNGAGVYASRSEMLSALAVAALAIREASEKLRAVDWPTDADWDVM